MCHTLRVPFLDSTNLDLLWESHSDRWNNHIKISHLSDTIHDIVQFSEITSKGTRSRWYGLAQVQTQLKTRRQLKIYKTIWNSS